MSYAGIFTDKNNTDHPVTSTLYGTCDTAAATAAKVVTCADVDALTSGMTIRVKFTNANTAASPTINVNSTGAKTVYRFGTTAPVDGDSWKAGEVVELLYDGTYFYMVSADDIGSKQDTLTFDDVPTDNSNNPVKSNGIYDALALKQNATDNSLDTTAKTIVGAINEHEGDIDSLKSGLTNLTDDVKLNTQDLTTPSRSINLMTLPITITKSLGSTGTVTNNNGVITLNGEFLKDEAIAITCADCIVPDDAIIAYMNNVALPSANISFHNGSTKHDYFSFSIPNRIIYTSTLVNVVGKTINRYEINFAANTTLDNFTFSLMMVHSGQDVSSYTPYIPSVESRIEAVESGLTNVTTTFKAEGSATDLSLWANDSGVVVLSTYIAALDKRVGFKRAADGTISSYVSD